MVSIKQLTALAALLFSPLTSCSPLIGVEKPVDPLIAGKWIVALRPGLSKREVDEHLNWVRGVHARSLTERALDVASLPGVEKIYEVGDFKGYAGSFDAVTVGLIQNAVEVGLQVSRLLLGLET